MTKGVGGPSHSDSSDLPTETSEPTEPGVAAKSESGAWQRTQAEEIWQVQIAVLRQRSGTRKQVTVTAPVSGAAVTDAKVDEDRPVSVDFGLEAVGDSVSVTGSIRTEWTSECRRCLDTVTGPIDVRVQEMFDPQPIEGETYALGAETLDLEPMVRDVIMLELPVAPLCRQDCPGPVPEAFEVLPEGAEPSDAETGEPARDPRWAALDGLELPD